MLMVPVACLAVWELRESYYEPKKQEAMRFCEALALKIDLARQKEGSTLRLSTSLGMRASKFRN